MREFLSDVWYGLKQMSVFELALVFAIMLLILIIPVAIYSAIQGEKRWQAYKIEHNCKVVAHISGSSSTGIAPIVGGKGGVGVVVTSTPSKTGWLCDDGITYYR